MKEQQAAMAGDALVREHGLHLAPQVDGRHPFLRFLKIGDVPRSPEMVIDGVMQAGQVVLTGSRGCGKSTIGITVAMLAAHLCRFDHPLRPKLRRNVVYIAEDVQQLMLAAEAYTRRFGPKAGFTMDDVRERIKFVQAVRIGVIEITGSVTGLLELSVENVSATGQRFAARPLVILDTRNATIATEEENNNAEASEALALLRVAFDVPTLLIAHPAKGNAGSTRGASAWESDAHQVIYVSVDEESRARTVHLSASKERDAKRRFESDIDYLLVESDVVTFEALDPLGDIVELRVRYCELMPETTTAKVARRTDAEVLRVLAAVRDGATSSNAVAKAVGGNKQHVLDLVNALKKQDLLSDENDGAVPTGSKKRELVCTAEGLARLA